MDSRWKNLHLEIFLEAIAEGAAGRSGNDTLRGCAGEDILRGQGGNDDLRGCGGNDTIEGGSGEDTLEGISGDDLLLGDDGRDTLIGGTGDDTLTGGAGRDTFRLLAGQDLAGGDTDLITDFDVNAPDSDLLDLTDFGFTDGGLGVGTLFDVWAVTDTGTDVNVLEYTGSSAIITAVSGVTDVFGNTFTTDGTFVIQSDESLIGDLDGATVLI